MPYPKEEGRRKKEEGRRKREEVLFATGFSACSTRIFLIVERACVSNRLLGLFVMADGGWYDRT
ncbi:hypothetical protein QUA54_13775 [Microcoleus sp. MOSTC5]|uniref:hypothetical protein n=1 Tax=Microcoleus sp. MOSTC5 TaxID=3055378 RepID=UPI002FD3BA71